MPYIERKHSGRRFQEQVKQRTMRVFLDDAEGSREFSYEVTSAGRDTAWVTSGSGVMNPKLFISIAADLLEIGFKYAFFEREAEGDEHRYVLADVVNRRK